MDSVNVHTAKTHLSRLLERVERGEEILIARNGTPVAKLTPLVGTPRRPGRLQGKIHLLDDFDDPIRVDTVGPAGGAVRGPRA